MLRPERFVDFSLKHYRAIVIGALIVAAIGMMIASGMVVDSGMQNMLPEDNRVFKASQALDAEFGNQDNVIVVVKGSADRSRPFLDDLAGRIRDANIASSVFYRIDHELLQKHAALYLPAEAYRGMDRELGDPDSPLSRYLDSPGIPSLAALFRQRLEAAPQADRLRFLDSFVRLVLPEPESVGQVPQSAGGAEPAELRRLYALLLFGSIETQRDGRLDLGSGGYLASETGEVHLMLIKPHISMENFVNDRTAFFTTLQKTIDETLALPVYHGLEAGYTGGQMVLDYEGDNMAMDDFVSTAVLTIVLILLLLVISFKRLVLPLASGIPLVVGTVLTAAISVLVYGSISVFSLSFAVLLLGLGIDFAIHILARYSEERTGGAGLREALVDMLRHTGPAMAAGSLTTAVVFLTFLLAEFRAFTQMGVMCALGIVMVLLSMITIMPSIIIWADRGRENRPYRDTEYTFLGPVGRLVQRYALAPIAAVVIIAALNWPAVMGLGIDANLRNLFPSDLPSIGWLDTVQEHFDYNPDTISLMAHDIADLEAKRAILSSLPTVAATESILDFLPDEQDYKASVLARVHERLGSGIERANAMTRLLQAGPGAADRMVQAVAAELSETASLASSIGISPEAESVKVLNAYAALLRTTAGRQVVSSMASGMAGSSTSLGDIVSIGPLQPIGLDDLPPDIIMAYRSPSGKLLIEITPAGSVWDHEFVQRLQHDLEQSGIGVASGMPLIFKELISLAKSDVMRISIIASIVVAAMLFAFMRSVKDTIIIMATVGSTLLLTIALGPAIGMGFNIANLLALPLIIGIGVDSGVHIIWRLRAPGVGIPDALIHTGRAVIMTTLTTLMGFGSLLFTDHPGLAEFGKVIVLGMSLCLILTLTLLPALYSLMRGRLRFKGLSDAA